MQRLATPAIIPVGLTVLLYALTWPSALEIKYYVVVVILAWPLVTVAALGREPRGWFAAFCSWSGRISYAVYALHQPIFDTVLLAFHGRYPLPLPVTLAMMACTVLAADIVTRFLDEPLRRRLVRAVERRRDEGAHARPQ